MDWMPKDGTFLHYTIDDFPVRIVCCDSVRADEVTGGLCAQGMDWLDRTLAEAPDKPTIVAMHHPPFGSGMAGTTSNGLVEGCRIGGDITPSPAGRAPHCRSHAHRPFTCPVRRHHRLCLAHYLLPIRVGDG